MISDDHLERLEKLARLHEAGMLNEAEFERSKALLLQQDRISNEAVDETPGPAPIKDANARKRRRLLWAVTAISLAGGGGWALAEWPSERPAYAGVSHIAPAPTNVKKSGLSLQAEAPPDASSIRSLSPERQVDLAMDAVFGRGLREIRTPEAAVFTYDKGKVIWTDFGPVLIAEGSGEPYPASSGTLGVFYLREIPGATFVELRRWPDAVMGSIMGNPPQWKVRNDVTSGAVVESSSGGVWQGYACDSTTLTELTETGPRALVTFDSRYDGSGAAYGGNESYQGTITNVVRNRSFDVLFSGTRSITQHFIRKGDQFIRIPEAGEEQGESTIPTC